MSATATATAETPVAEKTARVTRQESPATLGGVFKAFWAHGSPRVLAVTVTAAWAVRLWLGDWSIWDGVIVAATIGFWPIQEWLIHVFILHFKPRTILGRKIDLLAASEHRKHHRDPWNIPLVFIPTPIFYWAIPLEIVLWNVLLPTPAMAFTAIAFYFTMSMHYEWVHYLVHSRYRPTSRYYDSLWRSHRLHHCKNENYWYGVTMLEGDRLLGTQPDQKSVPLSPTCRTLGHEEDLGVHATA